MANCCHLQVMANCCHLTQLQIIANCCLLRHFFVQICTKMFPVCCCKNVHSHLCPSLVQHLAGMASIVLWKMWKLQWENDHWDSSKVFWSASVSTLASYHSGTQPHCMATLVLWRTDLNAVCNGICWWRIGKLLTWVEKVNGVVLAVKDFSQTLACNT